MKKVIRINLLTAVVILVVSSMSLAQGFVAPYPLPNLGDGAKVVLKSGDEISGKWYGMTGTPKNLKNIQVRNEEGTRIKYLTPDVERVYISLSGMMKFSMLMDASTATTTSGFIVKTETVNKKESIVNMSMNWDEVMNNSKDIIFDLVSETEGKYGMKQLLNPGFDSKYRAYSWGQAVQAMGKNYPEMMLINPEGEVTVVKMKTYGENFEKLFGDNDEFMEMFDVT
ncbi:MAG: hypothetical protein OCD76_13030 [Reichenbachiella sp.]